MHAADDTAVLVERTEPQSQKAQLKHEEQWYSDVNSECKCNGFTKCGDKCRAIVQSARSSSAMSTAAQRTALYQRIKVVRAYWREGCGHCTSNSAAADTARMPKELLPRMGPNGTTTPSTWPFMSQSTIDDVRAMRYIRSQHSTAAYGAAWQALQLRLQQYVTTGAGSVAEAVVCNDCYWCGETAYEKPSGGKAKAAQRRWRQKS
jgi:hypothetical protein